VRKVAVTGFGIVSPLGRGPAENSAALQAGRSGIVSMRPPWADAKLKSHVAGRVDPAPLREAFDRRQSRFLCDAAVLAATAFGDAVKHAELTPAQVQDPRTGLVLGTGSGASMADAVAHGDKVRERGGNRTGPFQVPLIMGSSLTANIGTIWKIRGHSYCITSACSTSAHAMMAGLDLIRSGRQDRVFAGGGEDLNVYVASAFDSMGALSSAYNDTPHRASRPLDRKRDGFVVGSGAAVVVLEELELARARGARIWAMLDGAAATCDGEDMVAPNGIGAQACMRLAMEDAGLRPEQVDYINLHGTSTPIGDVAEVEAIKAVFGARVPAFSSTKSMTGHALGAAGAHEAVFCLVMMADGFLAPNINLDDPEPVVADLPVVRECRRTQPQVVLSNSFGFGGTNCTLAFRRA